MVEINFSCVQAAISHIYTLQDLLDDLPEAGDEELENFQNTSVIPVPSLIPFEYITRDDEHATELVEQVSSTSHQEFRIIPIEEEFEVPVVKRETVVYDWRIVDSN